MKSPCLVVCDFNHYTAILTLRLIILTADLLIMDLIRNDVKNKMAAIVGGLCMEGLWRGWRFADRHEEIANYIRIWHVYYHLMVMRVFCLLLKIFGWFCYSRRHRV